MGGLIWVFPNFGKNAGTPQGGVSALSGGWVLLSLVDCQHCSWAEAHCDTFVMVTTFTSVSTWSSKKETSGAVSDPVVIAQVSPINVVSSNPPARNLSSCYGVVNLKLLCDPPPPLRVSSRCVGGSESGWVGQPKSREGQRTPPPPPPVSLSKGLGVMLVHGMTDCRGWRVVFVSAG